ncbi:MAG: hypothetical protein U5K54_29525 [Cytophagales bacterium]|nr:hypothetical protein [Cytophagales bacterium]
MACPVTSTSGNCVSIARMPLNYHWDDRPLKNPDRMEMVTADTRRSSIAFAGLNIQFAFQIFCCAADTPSSPIRLHYLLNRIHPNAVILYG